MLTCIAIDDEELALDLLEDNISKLPFLKFKKRFANPLLAIKYLQDEKVDLVFLDIHMPGLSGLEFIQGLINKPMFILVTAYQKFALDGFNLNVVDYLVKPVPLERFILACNKAFELHQLKKSTELYKNEPDWFFVNADYSMLKVNYDDIIWIEGLRDYVKMHLTNKQRPLVVRVSFKSLEIQLPKSRFIRIHKSYIVSKKHITAIRKNSIYLDTIELSVGEVYKQAITELAGKAPE